MLELNIKRKKFTCLIQLTHKRSMIQKNLEHTLVTNYFGKILYQCLYKYRIIKMFLEGKMFPYGTLSNEKWRMHVYDIANFVTTDQFL